MRVYIYIYILCRGSRGGGGGRAGEALTSDERIMIYRRSYRWRARLLASSVDEYILSDVAPSVYYNLMNTIRQSIGSMGQDCYRVDSWLG